MSDPRKSDAWNPTQYDRFKAERQQPGLDLVAGIDRSRPIGDAIDLGCGTGELTALLHRDVTPKRMLGIDSSPQMLEPSAGFASPGLSFRTGDIASFREQNAYDLVFSNAALQWVPDHRALFPRLFAAVRPGGQIAIQMPMNHDYPTHVLAREMGREAPYRERIASSGSSDAKETPLLAPEDYAQLLYRCGFRDPKVILRVYVHVLGNREEVVEWVKGTMLTAYEKALGADLFPLFLEEYRARLFDQLPDDRPFVYPFKRLLLWGRKDA